MPDGPCVPGRPLPDQGHTCVRDAAARLAIISRLTIALVSHGRRAHRCNCCLPHPKYDPIHSFHSNTAHRNIQLASSNPVTCSWFEQNKCRAFFLLALVCHLVVYCFEFLSIAEAPVRTLSRTRWAYTSRCVPTRYCSGGFLLVSDVASQNCHVIRFHPLWFCWCTYCNMAANKSSLVQLRFLVFCKLRTNRFRSVPTLCRVCTWSKKQMNFFR